LATSKNWVDTTLVNDVPSGVCRARSPTSGWRSWRSKGDGIRCAATRASPRSRSEWLCS